MAKDEGALRLEFNREVMGKIWSAIPKEPGTPVEMVRYLSTDLKYLYDFGFVDTRAYTYEEWEKAFEDYKQADGTYLFNKDQFIRLGRYKYTGHIKTPLDPLKIREGWYEIDTWRSFLVKNVIPSTTGLTVEFIKEGEKKALAQGLIVKGRIKIGKEVKLWLKQLLDNYPSPLRRREIDVQAAYDKLVAQAAAKSGKPISQKSTFEEGRKASDIKRKGLDEVLVKRTKIAAKAGATETVSLKDLRRKGVSAKSKKTTV
jgi:hypothetical protein